MSIKIIVILGPTASGKSDLAVKIAEQHNGEVISADSRQVYKGLDIGTGKITREEMRGIPHHLLDIREPNQIYTVVEWVADATKAIYDIAERGKTPIICGGTGFYISSLIDGVTLPDVTKNEELRNQLARVSTTDLFKQLQKLDPKRAATIDPENRRRLERAIEIATELGSVPEAVPNPNPDFEFIQIGISTDDVMLRERINKRLDSRIQIGMIDEARKLHTKGLGFERMRNLGLEYRYLADLIEGTITETQFRETLSNKIWQYARRQKAWFKRDHRIQWTTKDDVVKIEKLVSDFL